MQRKKCFLIAALLFLLTGFLASFQLTKALPSVSGNKTIGWVTTETIYIRANGTIEPSNAPISTVDNITYVLIDNITSDSDGIVVEKDNIVIDGAGYILQGNGSGNGIDLTDRRNVTVCNVTILDFGWGIASRLHHESLENKIVDSEIVHNGDGIVLYSGLDYIITGNRIADSTFQDGLWLYECNNVQIVRNEIDNNTRSGVTFATSSTGNYVRENNITGNAYGVYCDSDSNNIVHNNFVANVFQARGNTPAGMGTVNDWDRGYPSGGNYWSGFGVDMYKGTNQTDNGSDGISDLPYVINSVNIDHFPLVVPWRVPPCPPISFFAIDHAFPIVNETVNFNASTYRYDSLIDRYGFDANITQYNWDFGDASSTNVSIPFANHTYSTVGNFVVNLTVRNNEDVVSSFARTLTLRTHEQFPTAVFTYLPKKPTTDESVAFDASASSSVGGTILTYTWDFADGNIKTTSDPLINHRFDSSGYFNVTLTVKDSEGLPDVEIQTVRIYAPPVASFVHTPLDPTINATITFNASASYDPDGQIVASTWDFGDGEFGSGKIAEHAYREVGSYNVTLTVTDNEEYARNVTKQVNVGKLNSTVMLNVTPEEPTIGSSTEVKGSITPNRPNATVTIWQKLAEGSWNILTNVTTDLNSKYSYLWHPLELGTYELKANWEGDDYTLPSESVLSTVNCTRMPTSISIFTNCSSTLDAFKVEVKGTLLDIYSGRLKGETIVLSYTFAGIGIWTPVTSDSTDDLGEFRIVWFPPATGNYMLKAEWSGNSTHFGVSSTIAVSTIPYENQYVFTVESNSTISDLIFDQNSGHLSFGVSGENGTTGYTRVTIAKSLIIDVTKIKILVDGLEYNYTVIELNDSWVLLFTYNHSVHQVEVDLQAAIPEFPSFLTVALFMTATVLTVVAYKKASRKMENRFQ